MRRKSVARNHIKKEAIPVPGLFSVPVMSHVVKVGHTVYIAGQVARDASGNIVGAGDFHAQARKAFENVGHALRAAGATFDNVVSVTVYVTDRAFFSAEFSEILKQHFGTSSPPAMTGVVVGGLAFPEYLLEVQAVAVL